MRKDDDVSRLSRLLGSMALGLAMLLTLLLCFGCSSPDKPPAVVQDLVTSEDEPIVPDAVVVEATAVDPPLVEPDTEAPLPRAPEYSPTEIDLAPVSPLAQDVEGPASHGMLGRPPTEVPVSLLAAAARSGRSAELALGGSFGGPGFMQTTDGVAIVSLQATDSFSEPHVLLEEYDGYYGAGAVITQVRGTFVDPEEAWSRYQAGDLDVIIPPEGEVDSIQASPVYSPELHVFSDPTVYYYGFSTDAPPLDNSDLRAALSAAIDRERLISETLSGDEFPALTFAPPGMFGHVDGYAAGIGHPYSPTVANQYLSASGYLGTPTITLMFNDSPYHQAVAEAVRQMWIDTLGVTVTLESLPWPEYIDLIQSGSPAERPGIYRMGWRGDYPDAYNFLSLFRSDSDWNFARYSNSAFDGALDQAVTETMTPTRLSAYQEAESYLVMTDTAVAPLYYYPSYRMTASDVVRSPASWWGQHLDQWNFTGDARPLRVAWGNLTTLDPARASQQTDLNYVEQLFLGLTGVDEEGNVYPELATGWHVSPDGMVYTFTLRSDADWTDGSPVTAHDVEYGVLRSLTPEGGFPYAYVLHVIENAQEYQNGNLADPEQVGVEALDDTHIVFTLTEPAAYFPTIVALPPARPQPEWAISAHGNQWTAPGNIVTNGPYRLSEWVQAPAVGVYKESYASPGESGSHLFHIAFWNDGGAIASDVVITDTLEGMTYITDSTGLTHTGTGAPGDPLVWQMGDLEPYSQGDLFILASVDATAGEQVTNTVQIETANPYDAGTEKESVWSDEVVPNDTHLRVDKWAWTGDPAPGYESIHQIQVCNEGSTWSNEVVLTDTLHPSLTLQTWWAEPPWWTEVISSDHELVLSNSTIGSWTCQDIYLRVLLDADAWRDMTVTDTVRIASSNDIETEDNERTWSGNVQPPYTNLSVYKGWGFGQPIPGGRMGYYIDYRNDGNVPVGETIRLTDTLPVSTTFHDAFRWSDQGPQPVTPTLETDDYVVWQIDGLENGFGDNFIVVVYVDPGPGLPSTLLNTVEITEIPYERSYVDNTSSWSESVNAPGPNLRVTKSHEWWGDSQLLYRINVSNIGT
ncbi:MAG: ABC transporter substrate-binding protein, partial [Anaerolineae bacterium]